MFQKTFIRFVFAIVFTFSTAILLVAASKKQNLPGAINSREKCTEAIRTSIYGEYIIWESLGSTILSVNN